MKSLCSLFLTLMFLGTLVSAQPKHSFSLEVGGISTQNNQAQPATSLSGNFTRDLAQMNEYMLISLSIDISTYIQEGNRLSTCSGCTEIDYSGWDAGLRLNFVPTQSKLPVHVFTGVTRISTEGVGFPSDEVPDVLNADEIYGFPENYISYFWDLGISFDFPIAQNFFFATEALAGYSLETESGAQQGFERFELNAGIGVRF